MTFRVGVTIIRRQPGTYVKGSYVPSGSVATNMSILASVQPLNGEELKTLPEGRRLSDSVKVYTDAELIVLDETTNTEPDRMTWRGHIYECVSMFAHQMGVINHYKYIFSKVSQS